MKKARKSKFVIGGVALLSCVALAGVGYSSWVITSSVSSQTGNVSVTAADVEDDRITIGDITVGTTTGTTTTNNTYSFGPSTGGEGLISPSDSSVSEESLSVTFSFTVSWASTLGKTYDITLALTSSVTTTGSDGNTTTTDNTSALTSATGTTVSGTNSSVSGTYLAAPASGLVGSTGITIATVSSSGVTASSSYSSDISSGSAGLKVSVSNSTTSPATVNVTAAFGWGSYFGSSNPVNLSDESKLDDYVTGLKWLNENLNGATFTYTVGGSVQASTSGGDTENTETDEGGTD